MPKDIKGKKKKSIKLKLIIALVSLAITAMPILIISMSVISTIAIWYYAKDRDISIYSEADPFGYDNANGTGGSMYQNTDMSNVADSFAPRALGEAAMRALYIECQNRGVRFTQALAVMGHESEYNVLAVGYNRNSAGEVESTDRGLFQINDKIYGTESNEAWYARLAGLSTWNVFNPIDNIKMGVAGLQYYYSYWSNPKNGGYSGRELELRALNSYNLGVTGYSNYIAKHQGDYSRPYDRDIRERENHFIQLSAQFGEEFLITGETDKLFGDHTTDAVIAGVPIPWNPNLEIVSDYGWRTLTWEGKTRFHHGIDITLDPGRDTLAPIYPITNGVVVAARTYDTPQYRQYLPAYPGQSKASDNSIYGGSGQHVIVAHVINGTKYLTSYAHMYKVTVSEGQAVNSNTILGYEGSTGNSSGRHLHFAVRFNNGSSDTLNPWRFFGFDIKNWAANDKKIRLLPQLARDNSYLRGGSGRTLLDVQKR